MTGAGLDLGTSEYRVEANAFFESRLRLVYGFVLGASASFYLLGYAVVMAGPDISFGRGATETPSQAVNAAPCAVPLQ